MTGRHRCPFTAKWKMGFVSGDGSDPLNANGERHHLEFDR